MSSKLITVLLLMGPLLLLKGRCTRASKLRLLSFVFNHISLIRYIGFWGLLLLRTPSPGSSMPGNILPTNHLQLLSHTFAPSLITGAPSQDLAAKIKVVLLVVAMSLMLSSIHRCVLCIGKCSLKFPAFPLSPSPLKRS